MTTYPLTLAQEAAAQRAQQRAENNMHLTPGQYKGLGLVCIGLGIWASWITWRFFVHGSQAMEADPLVLEISIAAATMFIVCEMAAFALAKMLPSERLYALRWQLLAFAGAMLVFECVTIIMTQRGITMASDLHAKAVDSRASQLQASIEAQRAGATALRDAGAHSSKSVFMASRTDGTASVRQSLEVEQRLAAQADELAKVQLERKPTATELLGENGALYYAIARGLLVSCAGLVFFGAAGALLRASRTADASDAAPLPAVNYGAPGVAPQPANDGRFSVPATPKTGTGYGRTWAWGAAAVPLALAGAASFAPKPAQASQWPQPARAEILPHGVWGQTVQDGQEARFRVHNAAPNRGASAWGEAPAPAAAKQPLPALTTVAPSEAQQARSTGDEVATVSKSAHPGVSKSARFSKTKRLAEVPEKHATPDSATPSETPTKAKKMQHNTQTTPGVKVDTGVGERDGARYQRVKQGVLAGYIRPSVRSIQQAEGGSTKTVRGYLSELEREGLTERHGQGWKLKQGAQA